MILGEAQLWNIATGRTLSVSGAITGSANLTILGDGKVSLGASNVLANGAGAGNLIVSGTLDLNGTSQTVNAITGSGMVDNSGAGTASLTIGNNNAGGTFAGTIQDTGGDLALVKTGSGSLTLTGANTYSEGFTNNGSGNVLPNNDGAFGSGPVVFNGGTIYATATTTFSNTLALNGSTLRIGGANSYSGATNVASGTLVLEAGNVLPDATSVTIGAATLDAATFTDTAGTLGITGTATIALGTGAALAFADSSAVDWTGGTLNLTGTFVSSSSLRFGTSSSGLTDEQLLQITADGFTGFDLDENGFLTAAEQLGFASWQSANGTACGLDEDHDNDGVSNGIEYFLGGDTNTTGFTALPGVVDTGGTLSVTWTKAATGYAGTYPTDFVVETSDSLTGTWSPQTLGDTVVITGDEVKFTFPDGTKNFVRLKVTGP